MPGFSPRAKPNRFTTHLHCAFPPMLSVLATALPSVVLTLAFILLLTELRRKPCSTLYVLDAAAVCGVAMVWLVSALTEVLSATGASELYLQASARHGVYLATTLVALLLVPRAFLSLRRTP